ncbi:MAG: hypothetical protein K6T29_05670 [Peptococcaceae bacterium]|nr:hypothetical protein [Peptococcaceae bacterium]
MEFAPVDMEKVKERLTWDFDVKNEFKNREFRKEAGFTFVIDVWCGEPKVALYRIALNGSESIEIDRQPPLAMIVKAIEEQGGSPQKDGLYNINRELRTWIEENILAQGPGMSGPDPGKARRG